MSDLELRLLGKDEIALPPAVGRLGLSLAEIGAVTLLACVGQGARSDAAEDEMSDALESLRAKGLLRVSAEGSKIRITLNLNPDGENTQSQP